MSTNNLQKQKCPKCTKHESLEIIYGAPTREEAERIKKGLAIPGGFTLAEMDVTVQGLLHP